MKYILTLLCLFYGAVVFSQLSLPPLFADNMVLQQQVSNVVWGSAKPNESVSIQFLNQQFSAKANDAGDWRITLPPQPAFTKGEMKISTKTAAIKIVNIVYGDVWVCGGQSNMEFNMGEVSQTYPEEITAAGNKNIRFMIADHRFSNKEEKNFTASIPWQAIDTASIRKCSAIGYFFAKKINSKLNIPIGLIINPWGGTTQQAWMPAEALEEFPVYKSIYEKDILSIDMNAISEKKAQIDRQYRLDKESVYPVFAANLLTGYNDTDWDDFILPKQWEENGYPDVDGLAAFRIKFSLSASETGQDAVLHFPAIDDADSTFVNGNFVGFLHSWNEKRVYNIPHKFLKTGENIIQVKVEDTGGGGGFSEDDNNFYISVSNAGKEKKISLSGTAKIKFLTRIGFLSGNVTIDNLKNQPAVLFNGMMAPLLNYKIKGFIWYQGESNVPGHEEFKTLFPSFISSIRKRWGIGDFPFLFVQLSSYNPPLTEPVFSSWAALRYAQTFALKLPNTAMAVSYDVGDKMDLHPQRKKEPGERLAASALNMVYKLKNEVSSGPVFNKYHINSNTSITLEFDHIGKGLISSSEKLSGFELSYDGRVFKPAIAVISGKQVIVETEQMPVMIRYAWSNAPLHAGLFNKDGFPAIPFSIEVKLN